MVVRRVPWHGLGVVLDHAPRTPRRGAGGRRPDLDGGQGAAATARDGRASPATTPPSARTPTQVLGVVSDDYVVVQNRDCFAFLANLLGSELVFETAGSLWGGKQVFITAELPDHITVGGDEVRPYVVLSAWHTGTGAIRAMTTPVRAVCDNTVRAALERARAVYRVRHVGDPTGAAARGARRARHDRRLLPPVRRLRRPAGARADERARAARRARRSSTRTTPPSAAAR